MPPEDNVTQSELRGSRHILGARLADTPRHFVIFGIHQQGRGFSEKLDSVVKLAPVPLKQAAWLHIERLEILHESQAELDRFYFHVENGSRYPDETGSVFSTPDDAMAHATILSQELAPDISWHGLSIVVAIERGREIARVRIG